MHSVSDSPKKHQSDRLFPTNRTNTLEINDNKISSASSSSWQIRFPTQPHRSRASSDLAYWLALLDTVHISIHDVPFFPRTVTSLFSLSFSWSVPSSTKLKIKFSRARAALVSCDDSLSQCSCESPRNGEHYARKPSTRGSLVAPRTSKNSRAVAQWSTHGPSCNIDRPLGRRQHVQLQRAQRRR